MKNFTKLIFIALTLLLSFGGIAQTNRRDTKKSVAHRANYNRISAGAAHTLEIRNGTLWAWGRNSEGQLGDGTNEERDRPLQIGTDNRWVSISAGSYHSLGLRSDGTLWAWGSNLYGQLGDANIQNGNHPEQIGSDNNWVCIAAGGDYCLALKSNGTLWAWGANSSGQLGNGTFRNTATPVQIGTDTKWVSIAAGERHSLAITSDGTLWAWGDNDEGQLGTEKTDRHTPVQITDNKWVSIAAGASHSLAIKSDGTLWAWGSDAYGKLGDGGTNTDRTTPGQIGSDKWWVSIAAGQEHNLGINSEGRLYAWGANMSGQLGNGNTENRNSPAKIGTANNWVSIAVGESYSLGIKSDGTLLAWGENESYQLGNGISPDYTNTPIKIGTGTNWRSIAVGESHSLGIKSDGTLWAWGRNYSGQLGIGTGRDTARPVQIGTGTNWISIAAGANHSLGIKSDGTLWAWGNNYKGQLGNGMSNTAHSNPAKIGTGTNWISIAAGDEHSLGIKSDGTLWAWGENLYGQLGNGMHYMGWSGSDGRDTARPMQIGTGTNWISIAAGSNYSFGIKSDGTLWSWGHNWMGTLGRPNENMYAPGQIGTGTNWRSIAVGINHCLALKTDGTLWAWGSDYSGQLGDGGNNTQRNTPAQIGTGTNWMSISGGSYHSLAIRSDGTLWAWGSNYMGQLGNGTNGDNTGTNTPIQIGTGTNWLSIEGGERYSLALKSDGTLWAWGSNYCGQLGNDVPGEIIHSPSPVSVRLNVWLSVAAGENHSLGIKTNGTLWAWGLNDKGQLGNNSNNSSNFPVQIGNDTKWISIAAGSRHSLGLQADGTLWAWGHNSKGQLGLGETFDRLLPVQVGTDKDWVSIGAGSDHSMALKSDGTLWSWGLNDKGQLGNGNNTDRKTPGKAGSDDKWTALAVGSSHNLALRSDGTLWACGWNSDGQLGNNSQSNSNTFIQIGSNINWVTIEAGISHSLAIRSNGTLWAWGNNKNGQLGTGNNNPSLVPVQVGNLSKWTGVSAGFAHSHGLQSDGTLWSWGNNNLGQLGDGNKNTNRNTPFQIGHEVRWISISGGGEHSLALKSDRSGFCAAGYNKFGQLGNNNNNNSTAFAGYLDPFILLARYKIDLDSSSTIMARGLGATDTLGVITIRNNSTVSDSSSFARAVSISVNTGASLISKIDLPATAGFPVFKNDTLSAKANDHTVSVGTTVTLTDSVYKNLNIGSNAIVTFSRPVIYIKEFSTGPGVTLKFSNCSELRIAGKTAIGSNNQFNPDSKGLIIYSTGSVTIDKGSTANVSVYSLDKISVSGSASARVNMKGLFLANEIQSKHTTWDWNYFDVCESALVSVKRIVKNDIGFKVFPNPNEGRFRIELNSIINAPLHISITDYLGREVYQTTKPYFSGSTSMEIDLNHVLSSYYIIKVQMGDQTFYKKIMIVK